MPTEIYKTNFVYTIDGKEIEIIPLKIKYMKELMTTFDALKIAKTDNQSISILLECARIAMKQYDKDLSFSIEQIEDNFDLKTLYNILDFSAGIKINNETDELEKTSTGSEGTTWDSLDLAKLENEVFLLGIWKSYDELERSISIQELMSILTTIRDLDYEEKKFMAALQGINLDESSESNKGQQEWEDLKARVFSNGQAKDSKDILALQGQNAAKAGFGIGMGLDYEDLR